MDIPFTETGWFPLMITHFFKFSVRELLPVQTSCLDQADGDGDLYGGMGQITRMGASAAVPLPKSVATFHVCANGQTTPQRDICQSNDFLPSVRLWVVLFVVGVVKWFSLISLFLENIVRIVVLTLESLIFYLCLPKSPILEVADLNLSFGSVLW